MAKKKAEETINLDSILFKCRDILRAARNAGSFFEKRDMMLALVFLRFIGEKFEDGTAKLRKDLIAQGLDPDDPEIFAAFFDDATFTDGTYNLPLEARWSTIINTPAPQLNVALDTALHSIAASSKQLRGCFVEGTFTARNLAPNDIKKVVDEVNKISHKAFGKEKDLDYTYDNGRMFVIYSWNTFSTLIFVQECLKRFGDPGDQFVLIYREKDKNEIVPSNTEPPVQPPEEYQIPFSSILIESKNLIFRGAPGTGKSYLAKKIAADIISNGYFDDCALLSEEQKKQVEFVQFHPSYDYSDFVEGLRPKINDDGTMGFELQDGIFKKFVARARKNYEDSQKSVEVVEKEVTAQEAMEEFFSGVEFGVDTFRTINGSEFTVTSVDDRHINISIPGNAMANRLTLNLDEVRKMLESGQKFEKIKDITTFFRKTYATQGYSYDFALYQAIKSKKSTASKAKAKQEELKKYVFIIDEINRGEISKIFGELFFSIDPGYRGKVGEISTQYSNLHADPNEKFYIPENVYIIGTMNDIDRSVDSFDFAMRRRFRFVELKADECLEMLASLENEELQAEAIRRMTALNKAIVEVEDLNENYQIGAAYFLKLKTLGFDQLWTDYLQPLLQDYIQGMYDEAGIMDRFAQAYGYQKHSRGDANEAAQNQG